MLWIKLGSFLMFMAVALGAFGAHALREKLTGYYLDVYKTAVLYHFIHALGLFIVAWLTSATPGVEMVKYAGWAFVIGIVLFSGSLYLLSLTQIKWLGAVTPLGGLCFLLGWALIFLSTFANKS